VSRWVRSVEALPGGDRAQLSVPQIVESAIAIGDSEGLPAVSMQRVASKATSPGYRNEALLQSLQG
jgi:hypothetical protein